MRGFLSFLILWLVHKKPMTGSEIAEEIGKRKGCKPTPGTIYPALKQLVEKGAIKADSKGGKKYSITKTGNEELEIAKENFCKTFYDIFKN
ncbi:PadR family transcriptional regulator [Candidatus Micrarchaeota archaeon]|nr:PadR family transcriptional regulator [Candidatus Micrarchaeota archaeon]